MNIGKRKGRRENGRGKRKGGEIKIEEMERIT